MEEEKDNRQGPASNAKQSAEQPVDTNIWEHCTQTFLTQESSRKPVKTALFIGDKGAGKSTLIQAFLNQSGKRESSSPLEYYFGRKPSVVDSSKELAHLYEVGGGKPFSDLIKIPINAEQYPNTVLVVVLDLSKVRTLLDTLSFWLNVVRSTLSANERLQKRIPADSLKAIHDNLWSSHEDRKHLAPTAIPVLVVANKYDQFIKEDPEKQKWVCRALRFTCHRNGCTLIMTGMNDKPTINGFKAMLSHFLFGGEVATTADKEYTKPLYIPPGMDMLASIGEPKSLKTGGAGNVAAIEKLWKETVAEFYPEEGEEEAREELEKRPEPPENFPEERIDILLKQKMYSFGIYRAYRKGKIHSA